MNFELNHNVVRIVGFLCLTAVAIALIATHQMQMLPELAGAGLALLLFT